MRLELMTYALRKRGRDDVTVIQETGCGVDSSAVAQMVALETADNGCESLITAEQTSHESLVRLVAVWPTLTEWQQRQILQIVDGVSVQAVTDSIALPDSQVASVIKVNEPRLALSVRQPWAWLIVNGYKDVENRRWRTPIRERVWVHAGSRAVAKSDYDAFLERCRQHGITGFPARQEFECGGIVGSVRVSDCVQSSKSRWFEGPHGFVLSDPQTSEFQPLKGALGFFRVGSGPFHARE